MQRCGGVRWSSFTFVSTTSVVLQYILSLSEAVCHFLLHADFLFAEWYIELHWSGCSIADFGVTVPIPQSSPISTKPNYSLYNSSKWRWCCAYCELSRKCGLHNIPFEQSSSWVQVKMTSLYCKWMVVLQVNGLGDWIVKSCWSSFIFWSWMTSLCFILHRKYINISVTHSNISVAHP